MTKRIVQFDDNGEVIRNPAGRAAGITGVASISSRPYTADELDRIADDFNNRRPTTQTYSSGHTSNVGLTQNSSGLYSSGGGGKASVSKTTTTVSSTSVGGYGSEKVRPRLAFKHDGIEYWGSAHSNLDDTYFSDDDLIINAYGTIYVSKPFVKSAPNWFNPSSFGGGTQPHQILLDWKDFSPPPNFVSLDSWVSIIEQAKQAGIKRIICCCGAGLGRTGTALASLALASGYAESAEDAVKTIRTYYTHHAIETRGQELYIWCLTNNESHFPDGGFPRYSPQREVVRSKASLEFEEESADAWNSWTLNHKK